MPVAAAAGFCAMIIQLLSRACAVQQQCSRHGGEEEGGAEEERRVEDAKVSLARTSCDGVGCWVEDRKGR